MMNLKASENIIHFVSDGHMHESEAIGEQIIR
jgi:hypothetical protein